MRHECDLKSAVNTGKTSLVLEGIASEQGAGSGCGPDFIIVGCPNAGAKTL